MKFPSTRWSLVVAAGDAGDERVQAALSELIATYWQPLYHFARREHGREDAQDLVQSFFTLLLEKDSLEQVDEQRGRFRSYLLAAFRHHTINVGERQRAQRRGGGVSPISLDRFDDVEQRIEAGSTGELAADVAYDREWARGLIARALDLVGRQYRARGRGELFEALRAHLLEHDDRGYAEIALRLGVTEGALKVAAHRLRRRFKEALREEVAHTVVSGDDVDHELRHLVGIFGAGV